VFNKYWPGDCERAAGAHPNGRLNQVIPGGSHCPGALLNSPARGSRTAKRAAPGAQLASPGQPLAPKRSLAGGQRTRGLSGRDHRSTIPASWWRRQAAGRRQTSSCGCGLTNRVPADHQFAPRWFDQDAPVAARGRKNRL